ncbi:SAM-dependent methyltransferase [Sulfitobacter sabulilitoris]|uniref:Class I SAM-dependent methyltransferase n=1 Tax=Sulfitobacter sabulilitoris TaxID=2562655 RepID=A0A5S3QE26_9RHOB|nr:cyclopropane-fatty-acyl-phospholipid synthase family protein [Sulfitobacter sabulilitoris]TMM55412.1 class I SAM-dependent methyltransferase [Sulfitobacter sabulilitoris]
MWERLFDRFARGLFQTGQLDVTFPGGHTRRYGPGSGGPHVAVTIHDDATLRALCLNPDLGLGEGYMNGTVTMAPDALEPLLKLAVRNRETGGRMPGWMVAADAMRYGLRRWIQRNAPERARSNVAHHYDLNDDLYRLFLDRDMQYSCAYFTDPDMSLDAAQEAKKAHIAAKLCLTPECHVLDIGCGWGGMALTLARDHGVRVTGVTLSENQLETARARARDAGLQDRVTFRLEDYRDTGGQFDRIVSVGMLEHVGVPNYDDYFDRVARLLTDDGIALIHTIGRSAPPTAHSPWINKYIFPGGYVPSLSELSPAMERSGLWQSDIEIWRLHYAYTLRHWRDRFEANTGRLGILEDERFIRMWRYYLTACIVSFEDQRQAVYHLQLAKRRATVPITRDYLYRGPGRTATAPRIAAATARPRTGSRPQPVSVVPRAQERGG